MIRLFTLLFFGMALYGVLFGYVGAGLLSLLMAGLMMYAERHFAMSDQRWANNPMNAPRLPNNTLHDLDTYECECARAKD